MRYSQQCLHYFYNIQHAGQLNEQDADVIVSAIGTALQRDSVKLYVQHNQHSILVARFQAQGSVATIAGSEYICCWVEGKQLHDLCKLDSSLILKDLALSDLYIHIATLLEQCVKGLLKSL